MHGHGATHVDLLQAHDLFDSTQSDIPEWITKSFRRDVPRASATEVAELLSHMPETLKKGLMPFQWEGVRFGLQRHTRCLIGDEMGACAAPVFDVSQWQRLPDDLRVSSIAMSHTDAQRSDACDRCQHWEALYQNRDCLLNGTAVTSS